MRSAAERQDVPDIEVTALERSAGIDVAGEIDAYSLPRPVGWKVLVRPISVEKVSKGGIVLPEETKRAKAHLRYIGQVIGLGELAYRHAKYEGGAPWCKVGDWIAFGAYDGMVMRIRRPEHPAADDQGVLDLRLLNDDRVQAVFPGGYERFDAVIYSD
jgi:co-chaperonin GroES (HSP10)